MTPTEVANALHLQKNTIHMYCREGLIKGVKFGKVWRIPNDEFKRLVRDGISPKHEKSSTKTGA